MNRYGIEGPQDSSLLTFQPKHRSNDVWMHNVDTPLRCRRAGKFWKFISSRPLHDRVLEVLHQMGFYGVYQCGPMNMDAHLITTLVERWRPETHTFHFPVGEATITLQDVAVFWGLPIDGQPICGIDVSRTKEEWQQYCHEQLGFLPLPQQMEGSALSLLAIEAHLKGQNIDHLSSDDNVVQFARSCVLMMLGCVLCPDKSGNKVSLLYLAHMRDVATTGQYSWGSAVLANLYHELCEAAKSDTNGIAGGLQLVQMWAYSRITTIRPVRLGARIPLGATDNDLPPPPYGAKWSQWFSFTSTVSHSLTAFRGLFDRMKEHEFTWTPYEDDGVDLKSLPEECGSCHWRYRCPLINYHIVEMHYPDRVMRQFGMLQSIPRPPLAAQAQLHDETRQGKGNKNWTEHHAQYIEMWRARGDSVVESEIMRGPVASDDYMPWYFQHTRILISRSNHDIDEGGYHIAPTDVLHTVYEGLEEMDLASREASEDPVGQVRKLNDMTCRLMSFFKRHVLRNNHNQQRPVAEDTAVVASSKSQRQRKRRRSSTSNP